MTPAFHFAAAIAAGLLLLPVTVLADTEPPAGEGRALHHHERIERIEAKCEAEGLTPEQCRERIAEHRDRFKERAERIEAKCEAEGLTPEQCRERIAEHRKHRREHSD
jgi:hypothetical protein